MEADAQLMERVFAALKHDWVWDFFFASESAELDMLRHAVTNKNVATAEFDMTTLEAEPQTVIYQLGEKHRLLLMTSFSTGNITVGFAINEQITSSARLLSREKYLGRIVRDDENGTVLFIADQYSEHITEVSYFGLSSPSQREHVFTLCGSKRLKRVMEEFRRTGKYDFNELKKAVLYFFHSQEARKCPSCGKVPEAGCTCKLMMRRKMHPLDTETDLSNLKSFAGGYRGLANLRLITQGDTLFRAMFCCTTDMRLTTDPEARQRLGTFALCDAARRRSVHPLAFRMSPGGGVSSAHAVSPLDTFLLASIADAVMQDEPLHSTKALSMSSDTDTSLGKSRTDIEEDDSENAISKGYDSDGDVAMLGMGASRLATPNILALPSPTVAPVLTTINNPALAPSPLPNPPSSTPARDSTAAPPLSISTMTAATPSSTAQQCAPTTVPSSSPQQASSPPQHANSSPQEASSTATPPIPCTAQVVASAAAPTGIATTSMPISTLTSAPIPTSTPGPIPSSSESNIPFARYRPLHPPATSLPHRVESGASNPHTAAAALPRTSTAEVTTAPPRFIPQASAPTSTTSQPNPPPLQPPPIATAPRIAPMPVQARYILPSRNTPAPPGGIDKASEQLDERKRKAELRKARNRESAQKSNHKRKLMIQALKDDIAAAASREAHLRAREKLLREENRALRNAMASK